MPEVAESILSTMDGRSRVQLQEGLQVELLQRQLEQAAVWYRSPVFVATVAAVLTGAVIVVARETVVAR